nr:hypothetical protein [uncultured Sphingomonas sp.]
MAAGQPAQNLELDYRAGALGYDALVRGNLGLAERQLLASHAENRNDPAWLLNYGHLLARQGRVTEAYGIFQQVAAAPDAEIVLANGEIIGTREASQRASRQLRAKGLASR